MRLAAILDQASELQFTTRANNLGTWQILAWGLMAAYIFVQSTIKASHSFQHLRIS